MYKNVDGINVALTAEEEKALEDQRKIDIVTSLEMKNEEKREERNGLLAASDWTQSNDSPLTDEVKASWVTYRTALRNLSNHSNWPNLEDSDWPTKP